MTETRVINLIRFHEEGDEEAFKEESLKFAHELFADGKCELAQYVFGLFSDYYVVPQGEE